jgi:hypothetical protein
MFCPNCQAECLEYDELCQACGNNLKVSSKSLVPAQSHSSLPAILQHGQLARVAAGVGELAFGLGLGLLRRNIAGRAAKSASRALRSTPKLLPSPVFDGPGESLFPLQARTPKLPRGYEIEETAIYVSRVIRRRK